MKPSAHGVRFSGVVIAGCGKGDTALSHAEKVTSETPLLSDMADRMIRYPTHMGLKL